MHCTGQQSQKYGFVKIEFTLVRDSGGGLLVAIYILLVWTMDTFCQYSQSVMVGVSLECHSQKMSRNKIIIKHKQINMFLSFVFRENNANFSM